MGDITKNEPAVPGIADRSAFQAELDALRVRLSADRLLSFAAAPTFAVMAYLTAIHGGGMPDHGMCLMYWLMSAFHLGPWLKLISRR